MKSTDEIREAFLQFFEAREHKRVASSPLVPANDPTLLFTNAGMVQFKDTFTGKEVRPYRRATSSQRCLRAGGKHNDLENVGFTPRHHTFFEMLGNFSFGDYFKKEAIEFAWTFVTEVMGLSEERLAVTVFAGDDEIPADEEAARLWETVGVDPRRIYRFGRRDNYWQMGDTGPQGPCSEIHYYGGELSSEIWNADDIAESKGWLEIWNLVFMQFERSTADGPLSTLPKPCVDTGAGLERLAMILQGRASTYETDVFEDILTRLSQITGVQDRQHVSHRVIADHARATAFLVADGVQPSNEGRGYVLRRIMRRAIRHGKQLGLDAPFFHEACAAVIHRMEGAHPHLGRAAALIDKVASSEEASFRRTLDRGLKLLEERLETGQPLEADFVAELYDTYGFPIDLTRVIAEERGRTVDEQAAQEQVRRKQSQGKGGELNRVQGVEAIWYGLLESEGPTDFQGYEGLEGQAKVKALVVEGATVESTSTGPEVAVLLDATPFYGESGGQIGDGGVLRLASGRFVVERTSKPVPELVVHHGHVVEGTITLGDQVRATVDGARRLDVMRNHSATHLLHLALREVLGDHVQQKGSLVGPARLRFDFSHFEPVSPTELERIEDRVNALVLRNAETEVKLGNMEDARSAGAIMLFGEKYGDEVRMVRIGQDSLELCGGTHVRRSGDIGLFKIVSEGAVASGVRRIEALTGQGALDWVRTREQLLEASAAALKTRPEELAHRVLKLQARTKELERELEQARTQAALGGGAAQAEVESIGGVSVLFKRADGTPKKSLRNLADQLRDKLKSGVVVLTAKEDDRVAMLVAATKDLKGRVHAGDLVKAAMGAMGGSGGGRPDFAQGGGPAQSLEQGLAEVRRQMKTGT
ncbi:MAG: alanine--tRNA ligase [Myxococcota bacterium]